MPATSTERSKKLRKKRKEQGLVRKEVWIRPENDKYLKLVEQSMRGEGVELMIHFGEGVCHLHSPIYFNEGQSVLTTFKDGMGKVIRFKGE